MDNQQPYGVPSPAPMFQESHIDLRDYFAGLAMQSLLKGTFNNEYVVQNAWKIADDMVKARGAK